MFPVTHPSLVCPNVPFFEEILCRPSRTTYGSRGSSCAMAGNHRCLNPFTGKCAVAGGLTLPHGGGLHALQVHPYFVLPMVAKAREAASLKEAQYYSYQYCMTYQRRITASCSSGCAPFLSTTYHRFQPAPTHFCPETPTLCVLSSHGRMHTTTRSCQ